MRLQQYAYTTFCRQAIALSFCCLLIMAAVAGCARNAGRPAPEDSRTAEAPPSQLGRDTGQSVYGRGIAGDGTTAPDGTIARPPGVYDDSIYLPTRSKDDESKGEAQDISGAMNGALQPQGSAAGRNSPVKIGLLVPLSGQGKNIGQAILNAAQMAIFDMDASDFRLMPRDTKGTEKGARKAARDVLDNGAQIIIGPLFSDSVRAAGDVAGEYNVNLIGYSTDWRVAGDNVLTMGFLPYNQVRRVIRYASRNGYQEYGVITPDNVYGDAVMESYNPLASRLDLKTADVMRYTKDEANISPRLREFTKYDKRLKQEPLASQITLEDKIGESGDDESANRDKNEDEDKPDPGETIAMGPPPFDAALMAVGGEQARAIANLLSYYDLPPGRVKRLGTGLWDDAGLAGESNLDGAWYAAPDPRLRTDFEQRYAQNYDTDPPRLATLGYDSTALAVVLGRRGLQQDGQPAYGWSDLTAANGFAGIDGIFRFREGGLVDRGLAVLEINDGEIEVISPAPETFQRRKRLRNTNNQRQNVRAQPRRNQGGFRRQNTSY